jgi:phosphate transport system ATP-binding protein
LVDENMEISFCAPREEDSFKKEVTSKNEKMKSLGLSAWYSKIQALKNVTLSIKTNCVTAIIGPSGCGKSTFIRCLNRMHELVPDAKMSGQILLDGKDIYAAGVDPVLIRRRVGMVFQKPNPFPTMSIYDNVAAGLKLTGIKTGKMSLLICKPTHKPLDSMGRGKR